MNELKFSCELCNDTGIVEHEYLDFKIDCPHPGHQPVNENSIKVVKAITTLLDGIEVIPNKKVL